MHYYCLLYRVLSVTQSDYMHADNLTSGFLTRLLKVSLNVDLTHKMFANPDR